MAHFLQYRCPLKQLIVWAVLSVICPNVFASIAWAQAEDDAAEKVLSSDLFPWYDAESRTVRSLPLKPRPASSSAERSLIPPHVPPAGGSNTGLWNQSSQLLNWIFWTGLAVALLALFALLAWAFFRLEAKNRRSTAATTRRSLAQSIEQLPFQIDVGTGDFQALAKRAYEAGSYRQATILLFSHVLVTLDQANLIRLRKGKTNRQYFAELISHRLLSAYYGRIMESFESVFFGDHDISRADFESSWNRLPEFSQAVHEKLLQNRQVQA